MNKIALFFSRQSIVCLLSLLFFLPINYAYSDPDSALMPESEKNRQAAESYWDQARQYQADGDYPLALKYYRQGLDLWSDDQIIDRANRLESFLALRGQSQSEQTFEEHTNHTDSGASLDTSQQILLDKITGYLDSSDSDNIHTIDINSYGILRINIESESSLSTWIQLFDEKKNRLASSNTSSHHELIREDLAPGNYLVQIIRSGGQGLYEINPVHEQTSFMNDVEPNNLKDESQLIELGKITQGLLGYVAQGVLDSQDWFSFVIQDFGELSINVTAEDSLQLWMQLFDVDGNRLGSTQSSSHLELIRPDLSPGTYFVQLIRSGGHGGYEITPEQADSIFVSDAEPNNTKENAQAIDLNRVTQGLLGYVAQGVLDSQDWFSFETTSVEEFTVNVEAEDSLQLWMQLFDVNGNRLGSTSTSTSLELIRPNLEAGIYYIQLIRSGGHGGYTLRFGDDNTDDSDSSPLITSNAVEIEVVSPATGQGLSQGLANTFNAGESIVINFKSISGKANDWITLIAQDRPDNEFAEWVYTNGKVDGSHSFKPLSPGHYELRVYHDWPTGGYEVHLRIEILVE